MDEASYKRQLSHADQLREEGKYEESREFVCRALVARPDEPELLLRLGMAQVMTSPADAVGSLEAAAAASPSDPSVLFRAAHLLFHLGEHSSASRLAKAAARHATDDFVLRWPLVHLSGRLAAQQGKHELAERWLSAAFEEEPTVGGHGQALAEFLLARGRPNDALRVARTALGHRPADEALQRLVRGLSDDGAAPDEIDA